jgi:hypothetical protein
MSNLEERRPGNDPRVVAMRVAERHRRRRYRSFLQRLEAERQCSQQDQSP